MFQAMSHWPLLSLVTFLPLVGVGFIMTTRGDDEIVARNARNIALSTSVIVFLLSVLLWIDFDPATAPKQLYDNLADLSKRRKQVDEVFKAFAAELSDERHGVDRRV